MGARRAPDQAYAPPDRRGRSPSL